MAFGEISMEESEKVISFFNEIVSNPAPTSRALWHFEERQYLS